MRLRLVDVQTSDLPQSIGICAGDVPNLARLTNKCQRRLVFARESGNLGWFGSWSTMAFNVSQSSPWITTPRGVARLESMLVCKRPVKIQNDQYEYLDFGIGMQPSECPSTCNYLEGYQRNNAVTFLDVVPPQKVIRLYPTDPLDQDKRVLIGGKDDNSNTITSLDNGLMVQGTFVTLALPFVDTEMPFSEILGIQKDVTAGVVRFYEVDLNTGEQRLILSMDGGEQVANYRRYYINGLPRNCCNVPGQTTDTVQILAQAKLELIDVVSPTDYLLLQGGGALEALCYEAQSVRYSQIDGAEAKKQAQEAHMQAIRLLQGQLVDQFGKNRPAIGFMNFERESLQRAGIGMT